VIALILAGGQSRRMGTDKALLDVDGLPLIQRIYQVASACVEQVYVVGPARSALPADWQYLTESQPQQGPLLAFQQSLHQVTADWILLLACDLPYLEVSTIRCWQKDLETLSESSIAYLALHQSKESSNLKTYEALCGFYRDRCLPSLDRFVANSGRSFQDWLATVEVTTIPKPEPRIFTNWNSRSDLSDAGFLDQSW
jgi:molybdenum cofactor guanylyltransferase